jgi:hypothetical protein
MFVAPFSRSKDGTKKTVLIFFFVRHCQGYSDDSYFPEKNDVLMAWLRCSGCAVNFFAGIMEEWVWKTAAHFQMMGGTVEKVKKRILAILAYSKISHLRTAKSLRIKALRVFRQSRIA